MTTAGYTPCRAQHHKMDRESTRANKQQHKKRSSRSYFIARVWGTTDRDTVLQKKHSQTPRCAHHQHREHRQSREDSPDNCAPQVLDVLRSRPVLQVVQIVDKTLVFEVVLLRQICEEACMAINDRGDGNQDRRQERELTMKVMWVGEQLDEFDLQQEP